MHSFSWNSELEVVSELVFKPYNNDTDRNNDDVTEEILEITINLLNNGSEEIGNYSFTKTNESIQKANDFGKLMNTSIR